MRAPPALTTQSRLDVNGLMLGVAAYTWWALIAIYFKAIDHVPPVEVLAHRVLWSAPMLAVAITVLRRWPDLRAALAKPNTKCVLLASTVFIAVNWGLFIWAITNKRLNEASLGYFINPLVNVALGALLLKERLSRAQKIGLALAITGVVHQTLVVGSLPWVSLVLACSFGLYGLIRKLSPLGPLTGLFCEVAILFPLGLALSVWLLLNEQSSFLSGSTSTDLLLLVNGVITVVPLLCFAAAARRLPYSTLGFIQYIAPSGQLLLAVLAFGEPFTWRHAITFGFIWLALVVYTTDIVRSVRQSRRQPMPLEDL